MGRIEYRVTRTRELKFMNEENPWIEICPGIKRRTHAHGRTMYQMIAELDAGSRMPEHQHSQEQLVHILSGRMKLIVKGVPHELNPATLITSRVISRTE